jgi:ankyrin repeat protein
MWAAMTAEDPQVIVQLIARGANPNEADFLGGTALTGAAAYNRNPRIIQTLVNAGADINQTVNFDDSAARYAKNPAVIQKLIELGADPEHENVNGRNALDFAHKYQNEVGIKVLSEYSKGGSGGSTKTASGSD